MDNTIFGNIVDLMNKGFSFSSACKKMQICRSSSAGKLTPVQEAEIDEIKYSQSTGQVSRHKNGL